jgi:hypothetical protein
LKTAFLILSHHQPIQLARLVESLECDWGRIFIHVDKKADIKAFQEKVSKRGQICFLDDRSRVDIFRSGYGHVLATIHLLETALKSDEHFDRFCLLTGADLPIKDLEKIKSSFDSKKEYIRVDRRVGGRKKNKHDIYVRYIHFETSSIQNSIFNYLQIPRRIYNKIPLYHGCSYWSLTEGCVRYILDFVRNNPDYYTFHKYTHTSDEIFFHSIIKSSPFAENITHDFEKTSDKKAFFSLNEHGCHFIDWNAKGVRLPKVLTEGDLMNLLNSNALFARKFEEGESDQLIKLLNESIKNKNLSV